MTEQSAETVATPEADLRNNGVRDDDVGQETVRDSFARLYADGRAYAQAEVSRQKLRVGLVGSAVRDAAIFAVVAVMLLFAGLIALMVGLVIALTPALGPIGASFTVLGGAVLIAIILLLLAKGRITGLKKALKP